jgi:hypothetical protein
MQNFKLRGFRYEVINEHLSNKTNFEEVTSSNKENQLQNCLSLFKSGQSQINEPKSLKSTLVRTSRLRKRETEDFFGNELEVVYNYLNTCVATASMVAADTKIPQKNICRYKRWLEKAGLLWQVENEKCKITGYKAWYLTTNKKYIPHCRQLDLFE